jgi:RHS repeat-associated protein
LHIVEMQHRMEYELAQAAQRHYPLDWKEDSITHDLLIRFRDNFRSTTLEGLRYPLQLEWDHDYLPFGDEVPSTVGGRGSLYGAPELTQKFTGKERDAETASSAMEGLDYFGARYLSGAMGRFTSPDSYNIMQEMLKGKDEAEQRKVLSDYLSNPQEWNKYTYALNNPLKVVDPDGRNACGTNDDSKCKVTVTLQDRPKDKNGNYNDQFTGVRNQQEYNATATVSVNGTIVGTFLARTIPSDSDRFATIQNGTYSAVLGMHNGNPALRLNNGGAIPVVGGIDPATGADYADGILVHISGLNNFTGTFKRNGQEHGVSEGCQLICRSQYGGFLRDTGIKPDAGTPQRHFTVTVNTQENQAQQ